MHYLIKRDKSATMPMEVREHTDAFALESGKFSVQQLADKMTEKKIARLSTVQRADLQETYKFHDHKNQVEKLYIQGRERPIFVRSQRRSGGNVDFRQYTGKTIHVNIYNYNPMDKGTRQLVVPQTTKMVYYMFPSAGKYERIIGINEMEYNPKMSVGGVLKMLFEDESQYKKCRHYHNNLDLKVVYYEDGSVFFRKGQDENNSMREQLVKGKFQNQDPLLLFNWVPYEKFPYP